MNPIFELSAAPHMPFSLKTAQTAHFRPETIVNALLVAAGGGDVVITERGGEIFIAISDQH